MNWDNLKVFLAVARAGSLRGAAQSTRQSLSTVSRRIDALEDELGARLFDRRPDGYTLTEAGADILEDTEDLQRRASHIERKVLRRDQSLAGSVRVTLPDVVISHLLADDFVAFRDAHPEIDLQLITTYAVLDIMRGDADIALRFANAPDGQLVGRKLPAFCDSYYASRDYLAAVDLGDPAGGAAWIGYYDTPIVPDTVLAGPHPHLPVRWTINSLPARVAACKSGLGLAMLPCFIGDQEPSLVRVTDLPPTSLADTWLLVHPALRDAGRTRVVLDFFVNALTAKRDLLEGRSAFQVPLQQSA